MGKSKKVPLKLSNSLTKKTEEFFPITPEKVKIYCCGVTVYDLCHLGHARSYISWDVLRRYFIWLGYEVCFVQNFTDIDDKIIKKAAEENSTMEEVSQKNIEEFFIDMDAIGILRPDRMPKATDYLNSIKEMIENLERKGAAYSFEGDVYFSVKKYKDYGKLSKRNLEDQKVNAGGRLKNSDKKENNLDFALWKKAKSGEPSYSSKWGKGRPGWHIECSAMVLKELGKTIDIHLGGADLIFPHHENEIAQSEVCNGRELAKFWLHNGMVNVGGEKMSKSLGNFTTIRSLLEKGISPMTLRFFILQTNYRKPLDFTDEALKAASKGWERLNISLCFNNILKKEDQIKRKINLDKPIKKSFKVNDNDMLSKLLLDFEKHMNDDLNTSGALSILFELSQPIRKCINLLKQKEINELNPDYLNETYKKWLLLTELAGVLGLKAIYNKEQKVNKTIISNIEIEELIKERSSAKAKKDFNQADKIRNDLKNMNIELIDKPNGITEWKNI